MAAMPRANSEQFEEVDFQGPEPVFDEEFDRSAFLEAEDIDGSSEDPSAHLPKRSIWQRGVLLRAQRATGIVRNSPAAAADAFVGPLPTQLAPVVAPSYAPQMMRSQRAYNRKDSFDDTFTAPYPKADRPLKQFTRPETKAATANQAACSRSETRASTRGTESRAPSKDTTSQRTLSKASIMRRALKHHSRETTDASSSSSSRYRRAPTQEPDDAQSSTGQTCHLPPLSSKTR